MDAIAVSCSVAKHSSILDGYNSFLLWHREVPDWPMTVKQVLSVMATEDLQSSLSFIPYKMFECIIYINSEGRKTTPRLLPWCDMDQKLEV